MRLESATRTLIASGVAADDGLIIKISLNKEKRCRDCRSGLDHPQGNRSQNLSTTFNLGIQILGAADQSGCGGLVCGTNALLRNGCSDRPCVSIEIVKITVTSRVSIREIAEVVCSHSCDLVNMQVHFCGYFRRGYFAQRLPCSSKGQKTTGR
jgi:hypothetical protein